MAGDEWTEEFLSGIPIGRWRAKGDLVIVQSRAVPEVEQLVRHGGAPAEVAKSLLGEMIRWPKFRASGREPRKG